MVWSQSRRIGQEPEPPACHLRQNTQQHEEIFLQRPGTPLTVFRQLLKSLFPAITHPASPFPLQSAPSGTWKEDSEMSVRGRRPRRQITQKIDAHTDFTLSLDGARISSDFVNNCQEVDFVDII